MKPILFAEDNTNYDHNGISVLYDALKCEVYEEYNGIFDVELEYPADGEWADEIKEDRQILAKPNDVDEPHAFRIYEVEKDLESGIIYAKGTSITDDLSGNLIPYLSVTDATPQMALTAIKQSLIEPTIFDFVSDIDVRSSSEWTRINPLQAIVGTNGSLVDNWGGDVKRTNNTIYLYSRRGTDHAAVIRPGKNIDGFNMVVSKKGLITKILPYFTYTPETIPTYVMVEDYDGNMVKQQSYETESTVQKEQITVLGDVVVSENANKFAVNYYTPVDYSSDEYLKSMVDIFVQTRKDEAEASPTIIDNSGFPEELRQYVLDLLNTEAAGYFIYRNPGCDEPSVQIKADMIQLSDSPEWELYKDLENIQITDTVDVYVRKFNIDVEVTIQSIKYDSIGEKVIDITAGSARNSLTQSMTRTYESKTKELEDYIATLENGVYNSINLTANGQAKRFDGYTEPPASISSEGDLWFKEVGNGVVEIYMYTGGAWKPKVTGEEVMDRLIALGIDARDVTIVNLDASSITGGDLTVTDTFRIMHNGTPVLEVDAVTGQVKITAPNLATQDDLTGMQIGGQNYFVIYDALENKAMSWASGIPFTESGSLISGFIPCVSDEEFIMNYTRSQTGFYNANNEYLGATTATQSHFVIPNDVSLLSYKPTTMPTDTVIAYMRVSFRSNFLNGKTKEDVKVLIQKGNTLTDWHLSPEDLQAQIDNIALTPGPAGTGITSVTEYYLASASSSGVTTATAGWTTSVQTITSTNKYLWNYEKTVYTDGSERTTTPVIIGAYGNTGNTGGTGPAGKSITSITEYYLASSASSGITTSTAGWSTSMQATTETNKYLWNYELITYSDATTTTISPVIIGTHGATGPQGPQGDQGIQGPKGETGAGISSVVEYYLASASSSGVTTATSGWTTAIQTMTSTNKYLWNYEQINYTDGSSTTTTPIIIGVYGNTGGTGPAGKSITSITEYYLATSAASGVTTTTSGWTTTMQTTTTTNKYLWNYEVITYSDATTTTISPVIIGTHGATGATQYVHIRYSANSDGNPMTTTPQTDTAYIGLVNSTSATAPTDYASYTWSLFKGPQGDTGGQGIQGPAGADGTTTYTWVKYADTDTGTGLSDTPSGKRYIGLAFNKTTANESSVATDYVWSPLYDNVKVGGRNLALNSNIDVATSTYLVAEYTLSEDFIAGETYTASLKGTKLATQTFGLWQNAGSSFRGTLVDMGNNIWSLTFTAVAPTSGNERKIRLYQPASATAGACTVEWFQLEKGNVRTTYQEAPEDFKIGGRNLIVRYTETPDTYVDASGNIVNTSSALNHSTSDYIRVTPGDNLIFTRSDSTLLTGTTYFRWAWYSEDPTTKAKTYISRGANSSKTLPLTVLAGAAFIRMSYPTDSRPKGEIGSIPTGWSEAPEDTQWKLDNKAESSDMDALATIVSSVSAELNNKAGMGEFQAMQEAFNTRVAQDIIDKDKLASDLATLEGRTALVETIAGNNKLVTEFINTVITESEEGIYIANGSSSTGILISTNRISFMDNNVEVAYISNQTMQINHGIFVQSATISDFKFEKIPGTTILAVTWVGV